MVREDLPDLIYKTEAAKLAAIVDEIEEAHEAGRPVLVGTTSVEKSERLATMLRERSIPHQVLNAKYHEQEAAIVAQAGRKGAVTIATNMAGRGTDIVLGGNPDILAYELLERQGIKLLPEQDGSAGQNGPDRQGEGATATDAPDGDALLGQDGSSNGSAGQDSQNGTNGTHKGGVRELPLPEYHLAYQAAREQAQREITEREREEIVSSGGLHIIGSERHEARRIDNQLRGRAGRQGDPGSSRFYLSLDDDLMRRFGSDRIAGLMERLGLEDDQPIEHSIVSRSIEQAQQKVEGYNFDLRKHTVEYDDVMNKQREVIYGQRRKIMEAEDIRPIVMEIVRGQVERLVEQHTDSPRPDEWDLDGLYAAVTSMFGTELEHGPEELEGLSREDVTETVYGWAEELYQQKEQQYTPELMAYAARGTLLRIIDGLWVEHLTAIDDMIAGIGLRAYGQRDPLTEYKGEAYRMFQTLLDAVRSNLANAIFRIQFIAQPYAQPAPGPEGAQAPPPAPTAVRAAPAAPSAPPRRLQTNREQEEAPGAAGSRPGGGRPLVQDGRDGRRAVSRAERRQLEREARRQKNRTPNGGR
jgi:preprotein translocase subunit SecA